MKITEIQDSNITKKDLRPHCLSFAEVLGQSISNIAPSAGAALFIPATFAVSKNGTWLTFIFATIAVALVGYHVNHFAKKSSSPGALYTFVSDGLGEGAGFIAGSGLVIAYLLTASAVLAGFANYADVLLGYIGLHIPYLALCAFAVLSAWAITFKDIQVSAKLMLACEALSIALIVILAAIVLIKSPSIIDHAQIKLTGSSLTDIKSGLVLAIFSYVGFESATTLGTEAKNPLRSIPKAIILSGLCVGIYYAIISYIETLGFIGSATALNESSAPLKYLAEHNGVGILGFLTTIGAVISFWSCSVASITAGSRILLTMGRKKIIHPSFGSVHHDNETPHVAVSILSVVVFVMPAILFFFNVQVMDVFSWLATIATFGFLLAYALVVIAAPIYLYKKKDLKPANIFVSILTCVVLAIPIVGSVYPVQPYPYDEFPFVFVGWIILSAIWYAISSSRRNKLAKDAHNYALSRS